MSRAYQDRANVCEERCTCGTCVAPPALDILYTSYPALTRWANF
jgi:hypothetical protein